MSSTWLGSVASDPMGLTAAAQNAQSTRAQYAQYAIAQASSALSDGDNDRAITAFKKAVALDPNNTTAYNLLGKISLSQGKNDDAIEAYKQLVRIQSNLSTKDTSSNAPTLEDATMGLGNAYTQAQQYNLAEEQYKSAARLAPRDPLPPYTLGQLYLSQNRLDEAQTQFEKAKQLAPNDGNVYYGLGSVYNAQGNYMDAVETLQTSLQLKPDFAAANYELGVAYNGLNYTEGVNAQQEILNGEDTTLASQLTAVTKPKITGMDTESSLNTLNIALGPKTPVWVLDTSILEPDASTTITTVIQFSKAMDYDSVTNTANWSISRGHTPESGYYNNSMPLSDQDAKLLPIPLSVAYDPTRNEAYVKFRLAQNSTGNATIDPKHLVFTFNGTDASGETMDQTANAIDGYASASFGSIDLLA